ncbi:unnamed protein product [Chilo suppressalis]|uniref:RRM domain-containing protein n=1 Tax=Chilo suppressalis TaxID=168631 RepID=A0ABN8AZP3_CHISP|nr:unnamed protein product [Chilo suppressalis]
MSEQLKTVSAMNKLYIGNLPIEADEAAVRQLFAEQNLTVADISVKRGGYAFVDFPDQSAADRAIDKLHESFSYLYFIALYYLAPRVNSPLKIDATLTSKVSRVLSPWRGSSFPVWEGIARVWHECPQPTKCERHSTEGQQLRIPPWRLELTSTCSQEVDRPANGGAAAALLWRRRGAGIAAPLSHAPAPLLPAARAFLPAEFLTHYVQSPRVVRTGVLRVLALAYREHPRIPSPL